VRPEAAGEESVHLQPAACRGLLHGDRVQVRALRVTGDGRREGRVVRVVESASRRATGILEITGRRGRVTPYEARLARSIRIPRGALGGARHGMAVGVEIDELPDEQGVAVGRVVEVLGYPDQPGMDTTIIIRKYGLREEWPREVEREAEAAQSAVPEQELARREDFRSLPTVTIDGETAQDFDDAVSVQPLAAGGARLHVHIADVAYYVPQGCAMDREAAERGTSVYFPGRVVPMLPEKLSNELCSLRPGEPRLTQTVILDVAPGGEVRQARFVDGVIRSAERMTYTQVAGILGGEEEQLLERYGPLVQEFRRMESVCRWLWERRRQRGSIDFDLPEPEIVLNARGEMTGVFPSERNIAHRIIEEFMLAANEAVAAHLCRLKAPGLFRVHEQPDPRRLEVLDEAIAGLGYRLPRPLEALEPRDFQDLTDRASGKPEERFVTQMVLRAMMQARYDARNLGHFGLAAARYLHFTSPIRRYPDLVVHRVLRAVRQGRLAEGDRETERLRRRLPEVAVQSSRTERNAEEAERELEEWKKLAFMADKLGEEYHGFVSGVMPFGLFVQLEEYYVEGLIHISSLVDDFYHFDERRHLLRGDRSGRVLRLGDRLEVRVVKVDHFQRQMDLELVESPEAVRPRGRRRGRRPLRRRR
jgi:ribonuclease R